MKNHTGEFMAEIASWAEQYEKDILEYNVEKEYGDEYNIDNCRSFLQKDDGITPLHYLLRYYFLADHLELYGRPAAKALTAVNTSNEVDPEQLCREYRRVCREEFEYTPRDSDEKLLRGIVDLHNDKGNLFTWIQEEVEESGELKGIYNDLKGVDQIGPKIATLTLRDTVWIWDIEDEISAGQRAYLQPIDRWVERTATFLFEDLQDPSKRGLRERLADECETHEVSNIAFNQGAFYLGAKRADNPDHLEYLLRRMAE